MQRDKLIHFDLSLGEFSSFLPNMIDLARQRSSATVCVANVHMFVEAYRDRDFSKVINNADIVTPDGKPLTWGLRILNGIRQERVAGSDILPQLLRECEKQQLSVFFYGGSKALLDETSRFLGARYPGLKVAGFYSPPFRALTEEENAAVISRINDAAPNVVVVVLGCPKQEKWSACMKGKINSVMIGFGGALPLLIGTQKRAPLWMQHSGLEWLYRLYVEPRRLFKRYAVTNTLFVYIILKEFVRLKVRRTTARYNKA
ncbi:WecB/TagA/CpsF family glycosyltransferase [Puia dinghuensis]|uniref:UDP-N-acetyl-D-mannosaminuronic acid transferase n=1 Tax=Puia dinghuensis TaxID=1792502 RepID=A0A8J2UHX7_9BACT|nr:WecB/TagA/CpsF family glycosyltransferase [Puia dinghuensis]GGB20206.1 UDP-N-acetyl-D-mannosaminuronic acid transferase [Puia dinghuensis]